MSVRSFSPRATELFLQNRLNQLKPGQLAGCTNLLDLNIAQNWLPELPDDIGACQKLQYLYANANRFTQLPTTLPTLTNLVRLELHANQLTTLGNPLWDMMCVRRCCLSGLTQLRHLTLHSNQLTRLPECMCVDLTQLETLTLHSNRLEALPDNIGNLASLAGSMSLSTNRLTTLPGTYFDLTKLTELHAPENQLTHLPMQLSAATHLKKVVLSHNQLAELPSLEHLALDVLELDHNQLQRVPHGLCRVHCMKAPNLSHNCIGELPDDFQLVRAGSIDLSHNRLTHLPAMPQPQFQELNLRHNALASLPEQFPYGQTKLDVTNNQLTHLPEAAKAVPEWNLSCNTISDPGALLPWPNVTDLTLVHNGISRLPDNVGDFQGLLELNLDGNQLTTLPDDIGRLTQLRRLWLRNNQLTHLPASMSTCTSLAALVLSHNPALTELPLSFSSMLHLVELICDDTGVSSEVRHAILNSTRELRDTTSAARAASQMRMWEATARHVRRRPEHTPPATVTRPPHFSGPAPSPRPHEPSFPSPDALVDLGNLNSEQRQLLSEWMHRLENTRDFRRNQAELADVVLRILRTVVSDAEFAELFFAQASVNMAGCGDRASMSLNELYTAWTLHTMQTASGGQTAPGQPEADNAALLDERLALCIGVAKTNTLRQLVAAMHLTTESVETYLHVESRLRDSLGLVTACRCTLYGASADVDLFALAAQVNATYELHLFAYLEQHPRLFPDFPAELNPASTAMFESALEAIETTFAESGGQEQEYLMALNDLKLERERALLAERQVWLKQKQRTQCPRA